VEERHRARRRRGGSERFELILGGTRDSIDDRYPAATPLADKVSENREEGFACDRCRRERTHVDQDLATPSLVGVEAGERSPPDDRCGDVTKSP
jgi:hypothetical protein